MTKAAPLSAESEFARSVTLSISWAIEKSARHNGRPIIFEKVDGSDGSHYADSFGPFSDPAEALQFIDGRRRAARSAVEAFKLQLIEQLPKGGA